MFSTPQAITAVGRFHLYIPRSTNARAYIRTRAIRVFVYTFVRSHIRLIDQCDDLRCSSIRRSVAGNRMKKHEIFASARNVLNILNFYATI